MPWFDHRIYFHSNNNYWTDVSSKAWFQAVIRGDVNSIRIDNKVNIQDGAIIHGTYERAGTTIGNNDALGQQNIR